MATKQTAKKTSTTKTGAKQTGTTKTAPKSTVENAVDELTAAIGDTTERLEDAVELMVRFARDAAHTYVGAGFVIQDKLARRDFGLVDYQAFLDQAKAKGDEQIAEFQARIEPLTSKVNQAVEPITDLIETNLPKPVKDALDAGRDRVRDLLAV